MSDGEGTREAVDVHDGRWMTSEEAARYLACSPARIRYLVRIRRLRCVRDVRRLLFRRAWLDAALTEPQESSR